MTYRMTKKEIYRIYNKVYAVGCCQLQNLLRFSDPVYYTCCRTGWDSDIYEFNNNIAISTGDRPFGIDINYKLCKDYDTKAYNIWHNDILTYDEKKEQINTLLQEFITTITEE